MLPSSWILKNIRKSTTQKRIPWTCYWLICHDTRPITHRSVNKPCYRPIRSPQHDLLILIHLLHLQRNITTVLLIHRISVVEAKKSIKEMFWVKYKGASRFFSEKIVIFVSLAGVRWSWQDVRGQFSLCSGEVIFEICYFSTLGCLIFTEIGTKIGSYLSGWVCVLSLWLNEKHSTITDVQTWP